VVARRKPRHQLGLGWRPSVALYRGVGEHHDVRLGLGEQVGGLMCAICERLRSLLSVEEPPVPGATMREMPETPGGAIAASPTRWSDCPVE
jgi:hypothetical protein